LKVTIISPQIALPFLRYKDGIGLGRRLRERTGQLGRADNVESIWISGDGSALNCPYDYKYYSEYGSESLISSCNTDRVLMLEVGYLHIDNPIAIISSSDRSDFNKSAGLLLLEGFDLDEVPLTEMQACWIN